MTIGPQWGVIFWFSMAMGLAIVFVALVQARRGRFWRDES